MEQSTLAFNNDIIAYLEELEDLRRPARLRFAGDNGGIVSLTAKVTALQTEGAEPGFWADGTIHIPLERLVSVDGRQLQAFS